MSDICDLFIVESFSSSDNVNHEGGDIANSLRKIGKHPIFISVGTQEELKQALNMFKDSHYRFIHFSCHGSPHSLTLAKSGDLSYSDFAQLSRNCFNAKRVFFSSCCLGNKDFSEEVATHNLGIQSVIAPINEISSILSVPLWCSFYSSILLPKIQSDSNISEKNKLTLSDVMHNFGHVVALYGTPFHISYHETSKHILYHKKMIPGKGSEHYSFFSSIKPYDHLNLR